MWNEDFFKRYNTEDIINAVILMSMDETLSKDIVIPACEMIASNALCKYVSNSNLLFDIKAYINMKNIAEDVLEPKVQQVVEMSLRHVNDSDDKKNDFLKSILMQMKNVSYRGDGYIFQLLELAEKFYIPFDDDFKEVYGFSFSSCEKVLIYIYNVYLVQLSLCINEKIRFEFINNHAFRVNKKDLYQKFNQNEMNYMFDYLSVKIGIDIIAPVSLDDFKILYSKPFVDFGEYVYIPLFNIALMNMPKLFHYTFIAEKKFSKIVKEKYTKNRGDVVEQLAQQYLKRLFDTTYVSLKYPYPDATYEADVTAQSENATIFAEAKGKILTLASLHGQVDALKKDVFDAIGKAYEQAIRSVQHINENGVFVNSDGDKVELVNTAWKFPVCVMAENFVSIPSEIYNYIDVKEEYLLPYAVNIYDLDIITRECVSKEEFISYMLFRQMNLRKLSAMDELDIFGYFKRNGMKEIACDENAEIWATEYTEEFDRRYNDENREWFIRFTENNLL